MNWIQIGRLLRTAFLLRVPLITLAVLVALAPVSLFLGKDLLGNLFDQRVLEFSSTAAPSVSTWWTGWYLYSVSFAAFLAAFTAVAVINLILHYGKDRFDDPALSLDQKRPLLTFFTGIAAALILVVCTEYQSKATSLGHGIAWAMPTLGFLAALALVLAAKAVQLFFTNPKTTRHPPPYLIFPVYLIEPLERLFDVLYCSNPGPVSWTKKLVNRMSQCPLEILRCAGQGLLIDLKAPKGRLALRSGHVFAFALSVMAFAAYIGIGYGKSKITSGPAVFPALVFLLLFLLVLCWVLGSFTFFFDRYRVPLLSGLAVLSLATITVPQSDHVYRVEKRTQPDRISPAALVRKRTDGGKKRIILVATAGGGIQAAAWTARVLRGLEEECDRHSEQSNQGLCNFRDSVVLISGVSGGSLGAIAYARSFTGVPAPIKPEDVPANAARPALDEVAWGWMNPDVWNSILPWFRTQYIDRGWALEEKWAAIHNTYVPSVSRFRRLAGTDFGAETWLGGWAKETKEKTMPALLLNATLVEKGQPLVFSSTDFPHANDPRGLQDFYGMYPGFDVRVTTAARLSASFPYVAPAARANATPVTAGADHVVDGGYYDNYGITALLGWLENAINDQSFDPAVLKDVLILQIRPFAEGAPSLPREVGWGFQVGAPVAALLDVRDTGQSKRDQTELSLFTKAYKTQVRVWRADFFYPDSFAQENEDCAQPPLSWKLSLEQTECLTTAWGKLQDGWKKVQNNGNPQKSSDPIGCVIHYLHDLPVEPATKARPHPGSVKAASGDGAAKSESPIAFCRAGDDYRRDQR